MKFKSQQVEDEFHSVTVLLQDMAEACENYVQEHFSKELIITRVLEKVCNDSEVHEERRAWDARNEHDGNFVFTDDEALAICRYMNTRYPRKDGKPTMIHHSFAGGPKHLHCQIALTTTVYEPTTNVPINQLPPLQ